MAIDERRRIPWVWGATRDEVAAFYECDRFAPEHGVRVIRAVSTTSAAADCFLWICQLRRAPYSYDLIDNFGRPSPRVLRRELSNLRIGQTFMTIFRLVSFDEGRSITLQMKNGWPERLFGAIALTYCVVEREDGVVRLISAMSMPPVGRVFVRSRRLALTWADLVMMRKQLKVLSGLAEGRGGFESVRQR
jgi:hypothetical protein